MLYMAPEVASGERYNESADTFSFALVLPVFARLGHFSHTAQPERPTPPTVLHRWRKHTALHLCLLLNNPGSPEANVQRPEKQGASSRLRLQAQAVPHLR